MSQKKIVWALIFCLSVVPFLGAQGTRTDTGALRGVISDGQGNPLPGVTITVSSPKLMGTENAITNADGIYRIPLLSVGTYTLTAELPGFQPVKREGIIISLGATMTVNLDMTASTIEEQITVVGSAPLVDVKTSSMSKTLSQDILQNIPVARDLFAAVNLAPGVVGGSPQTTQIKGSAVNNNVFSLDGLYANDPDNSGAHGTMFDFNVMEEVQVVTGGMPAEMGIASGGFINVLTKSGGNTFTGMLQAYYDNEDFSMVILPEDEVKALGLGKPAVPVYSYDLSGSLGGPIIKDKLWFFVNGRYTADKRGSGFVPWTDPMGTSYGEYDLTSHIADVFLKLSYKPSNALRFSVSGNLRQQINNSAQSGIYNPFGFGSRMDPQNFYHLIPIVTWIPNDNTILELKGGFVGKYMEYPLYHSELPFYTDSYTSYNWGSTERELATGRPSKQLSANVTRFQDDFLGGDHEMKAGAEIVYGASDQKIWKVEPLRWYWYNGNPYYYRGLYNLSGPHPTYGDGRINLYVAGMTKDEASTNDAHSLRIGAYIQDSMIIKNRLTINFGLRFDQTRGWFPDFGKGKSGGIAEAVGAAVLLPKYGFNPYAEFREKGVDPIIKWNIISPRLGVTYDVFGDGKTAVRISAGRYSDWLNASLFQSVHPLYYKYYRFYWTDSNNNGVPDEPPSDTYKIDPSTSPLEMLRSFWTKRISEDIKSPYTDEISLSLDHELLPNFKVGLGFQYKNKSNIVDGALMDPDTGKPFYQPDSGYWVPFTTTVPARDQFPAQQVTMYFASKDAPEMFSSLMNIPEAYRKYSGIEITFDKRMSRGWQLGGSLNLSKSWGNHQGTYNDVHGGAASGNSPNWLVNNDGRLSDDKPVQVKLFGVFYLPAGFIGSFFYNYYSGTPWGRSVTVTPPASWAAANNVNPLLTYSVNLEEPGARRTYTFQNCDLRLEKKFSLGKFGMLGVYVDVFNLFGNHYLNYTLDPGGTWRPTDNNVTTGTYSPSGSYKRITSITNLSRVFRFSFRYSF